MHQILDGNQGIKRKLHPKEKKKEVLFSRAIESIKYHAKYQRIKMEFAVKIVKIHNMAGWRNKKFKRRPGNPRAITPIPVGQNAVKIDKTDSSFY